MHAFALENNPVGLKRKRTAEQDIIIINNFKAQNVVPSDVILFQILVPRDYSKRSPPPPPPPPPHTHTHTQHTQRNGKVETE